MDEFINERNRVIGLLFDGRIEDYKPHFTYKFNEIYNSEGKLISRVKPSEDCTDSPAIQQLKMLYMCMTITDTLNYKPEIPYKKENQ